METEGVGAIGTGSRTVTGPAEAGHYVLRVRLKPDTTYDGDVMSTVA